MVCTGLNMLEKRAGEDRKEDATLNRETEELKETQTSVG